MYCPTEGALALGIAQLPTTHWSIGCRAERLRRQSRSGVKGAVKVFHRGGGKGDHFFLILGRNRVQIRIAGDADR